MDINKAVLTLPSLLFENAQEYLSKVNKFSINYHNDLMQGSHVAILDL